MPVQQLPQPTRATRVINYDLRHVLRSAGTGRLGTGESTFTVLVIIIILRPIASRKGAYHIGVRMDGRVAVFTEMETRPRGHLNHGVGVFQLSVLVNNCVLLLKLLEEIHLFLRCVLHS